MILDLGLANGKLDAIGAFQNACIPMLALSVPVPRLTILILVRPIVRQGR